MVNVPLLFLRRDSPSKKGVGWVMLIPLKLFSVLDGNGNMFPETSVS